MFSYFGILPASKSCPVDLKFSILEERQRKKNVVSSNCEEEEGLGKSISLSFEPASSFPYKNFQSNLYDIIKLAHFIRNFFVSAPSLKDYYLGFNTNNSQVSVIKHASGKSQ